MTSEKALRAAGKELQDVMVMDPPIAHKTAKVAVLVEQIKEAISEIKPGDEFSEETQAVIDELNGTPEDEEDETPAPKKKVVKKAIPVEEEEDEPEDEEESLEDQINAAVKLVELTPIVKANPEFKSLIKKLPTYTKGSQLKAAMLELLAPEEEEEEEVVAPVKKGAKKAAVVEEDEDEEADEKPAKKKGTGKPASFTSTKETLGTTRGLEVFKGMQAIKGAQTIEAIATAADARFVKAGGTSNLKQSKNLVKVFLQAAIEWGIVVEKGGKLSNP